MAVIQVDTLKEKTLYNSDLLIGDTFIFLPGGVTITRTLIDSLKLWGVKEINCLGTISADALMVGDTRSTPMMAKKVSESAEDFCERLSELTEETEIKLTSADENEKIDALTVLHNEYIKYIKYVYTHYATHSQIDRKELAKIIERLCNFIKEHRHNLMKIEMNNHSNRKDFLVYHSLRSTIIAIMIAYQMEMSDDEVNRLATACVLHEIGMIRIPPQLYLTDKQLTAKEISQISTHTLAGYNILKELGFPQEIQAVALEHHEKENGTGYPRHMTGNTISAFAKIISVACAFDAITSPRIYKEEHSNYEAMVELLKNNNKQYDENVTKALLRCMSLYPIGTFVYLSNGKIGLVSEVDPDQPLNPIVQLVNEKDKNGNNVIIHTDNANLKISRVLNKKETSDVLASLAGI